MRMRNIAETVAGLLVVGAGWVLAVEAQQQFIHWIIGVEPFAVQQMRERMDAQDCEIDRLRALVEGHLEHHDCEPSEAQGKVAQL